jgi:hypothetical protein
MSQCQVCGKPGEWVFDDRGSRLAIVCDSPPCQFRALQGFDLGKSEKPKSDDAGEAGESEK